MGSFLLEMLIQVLIYIFVGQGNWLGGSYGGDYDRGYDSTDLSTGDTKRQESSPLPAAVMFLLLGFLVGVMSLAFYRQRIIMTAPWRIVTLLLSPVFCGWLCWRLCAPSRRARKYRTETASTSWYFTYGFLLAAPVAIIRFFCIQ